MTASVRLTRDRLCQIERSLSRRDREVVETVARLGLMSSRQIRTAFYRAEDGQLLGKRSVQKSLAKLESAELLARLARRVGGARKGSDGYVYVLGRAGKRLSDDWLNRKPGRTRRHHEPGLQFFAHRLAVAELFADLKSAEANQQLHVVGFLGEPECWRSRVGPFGQNITLKPDAYLRLTFDSRELHWFIEADMATESQTVIARKGRAYLDHYRSGIERQVMPRIAWLTTTPERAARLSQTLHGLGESAPQIHAVALAENAFELLKGETT